MHFRIISPNNELIWSMVALNIGIHITPRIHIRPKQLNDKIAMIPIRDIPPQKFFFAWYEKPYLNEENKAFRDFMYEFNKSVDKFLEHMDL